MSAKVIQVIETELQLCGSGESQQSPMRIIRQYWTLDGKLLAEVDPCSRVVPIEQEPTPAKEKP